MENSQNINKESISKVQLDYEKAL